MKSFPQLIAMLALVGCAGASDATPTSTAPPSTPPPSTTANAPAPSAVEEVRVTAPGCGYGGSAPAVAVFVDVTTPIALTNVTVSFTLADPATGDPRGLSQGYESLAISPVERGLDDFSTQGTTPFTGSLAAGTTTRLQYFAGLGEDPAHPMPAGAIGDALRVNVVVHATEGTYAATCDTAQMWPSS